jgi:Abnormal spindle-like microcephaly-assoc'd, ASPM-SPD-2-Hydin/IPT/TIG domain
VVISWTPVVATAGVLSASANPVVFGQPLTMTFALSWDHTLVPAPAGTVEYGTYDTNTRIESPIGYVNVNPFSGGVVTFPMPVLAVGYTAIWASYSGDDNHAPFKTGYYNQETSAGITTHTIDASALDFGSINVGTSTSKTLTIMNTGNVAFQMATAAVDQPMFSVASSTCMTPVAPGNTCQVTVGFSPTQGGTTSATLSITDAWGTIDTVALSGTGLATAPAITAVSPAFGPKRGGTSVTITGRNLVDVRRIMFGDMPATSFTCPSADTCTAISPRGTTTVHITVVTATGATPHTVADQYRYLKNPRSRHGGRNSHHH